MRPKALWNHTRSSSAKNADLRRVIQSPYLCSYDNLLPADSRGQVPDKDDPVCVVALEVHVRAPFPRHAPPPLEEQRRASSNSGCEDAPVAGGALKMSETVKTPTGQTTKPYDPLLLQSLSRCSAACATCCGDARRSAAASWSMAHLTLRRRRSTCNVSRGRPWFGDFWENRAIWS